MTRRSLACAALLLLSVGCKKPVWAPVTSALGGFSVEMPCTPTAQTADEVTTLSCSRAWDYLFSVVWTDIPNASARDPNELLEAAEEDAARDLRRQNAKILGRTDVQTKVPYRVREIHYKRGNTYGTTRVILVRERLYYIVAETVGQHGKSVHSFFRSFRLVEPTDGGDTTTAPRHSTERVRALTKSYVALLSTNRADEAYRYLPKQMRRHITAAAHRQYWRNQATAKQMGAARIVRINVNERPGVVMLRTAPKKTLALEIHGSTADPGIVPRALVKLVPESASGGGTPVTIEQGWIPLAIGNDWTYTLELKRSTRTPGQKEKTEILTGTAAQRVVKRQDGGMIVRTTVEARNVKLPIEEPSQFAALLLTESDGIYMAAQWDVGRSEHVGGRQDYDPPLKVLALPLTETEAWDVGTHRLAGRSFKVARRVAGRQSMSTLAGDFKNCIRVRTEGTVSGAKISEGFVNETEWYAEGVGLIKRVREETFFVNKTQITERTTLRLRPGYVAKAR